MKSNITNQITKRQYLKVEAFFDGQTNTVTYLVWDKKSNEAAIIDPVFDYDSTTGQMHTKSSDKVLLLADKNKLYTPHSKTRKS